MTETKIAIITDIHHGPDRGTKKGTRALPLMDEFIQWVDQQKPDFVVDMGDRISDVDPATDRIHSADVAERFEKIDGPKFHLLGNHDVEELSVQDNEKIMSVSFGPHSIRHKDISFIFWNMRVNLHEKDGFSMLDTDLEWLEEALAASTFPTVIFTHVPLDNGSMVGNFYFEKTYAHQAHYPASQAAKARDIIERSGKVVLCVNGHAHWTAYHCIDGIHYVTLPSLTETFVTWPEPQEAWAMLTISDSIRIDVLGREPATFSLPFRREGHHWYNIDKDYAFAKTES